MTAGHRHHLIVLRQSSRLLRWGQHPLVSTTDHERAENSRWTWREVFGEVISTEEVDGKLNTFHATQYDLTPLGILHALTGLTVIVAPDDDDEAMGI